MKVWNSIGTPYYGDRWPDHWTARDKAQMSKYYDAMPEEFYSLLKLHVIGPEEAEAWCKQISRSFKTLHFAESMSGSGRLSLTALLSGMHIGFPIDYRYGWDLKMPHRVVCPTLQPMEFKSEHSKARTPCSKQSSGHSNSRLDGSSVKEMSTRSTSRSGGKPEALSALQGAWVACL